MTAYGHVMMLAATHDIAPIGMQSTGPKRTVGIRASLTLPQIQVVKGRKGRANLRALTTLKIGLISNMDMPKPDTTGGTRVARQCAFDTGAA